MLSVTTDYARDTGDPSPYLKRIADAGFSHIHRCHHWNTDFLYSRWEIEQIREWLEDYGLQLLDLHGSAGREKNWASEEEYQRLSGVELARNRIEMASYLSSDVIIMHVPGDPDSVPIQKTLDELEPTARERNVRIAAENGNFEAIGKLLSEKHLFNPGNMFKSCLKFIRRNSKKALAFPDVQGIYNFALFKVRIVINLNSF